MEEQAQAAERPDGFRAGSVVELVVISYRDGRSAASFASMFGPSPREVIDNVCRMSNDRSPYNLQIEPVTAAVDGDPSARRVVSVELREAVDVGRGPLVAVVNGMSARDLRAGLQSIVNGR